MVEAEKLAIVWQQEGWNKPDRELNNVFEKVCQNLGSLLTIQSAPFGEGVFTGFSCLGAFNKRIPHRSKSWLLVIKAQSKKTDFLIFHLSKNGRRLRRELEARVSAPSPVAHFTTTANLDAVAAALLDALPMSRYVGANTSTEITALHQQKPSYPPTKTYDLFTLRYHPRYGWLPNKVGTAALGETKDEFVWRVSYLRKLPPKSALWARPQSERGARPIQEPSSASGATLSFPAGYTGFRYGHPLVKNDPLLSKSYLIGIFTEVRSGTFTGLRWYWDFAPKVKARVKGEDLDFSWSRATLGWSFGLGLDSLVTRIDLVPKIGLMDFDATAGIPSAVDPGIIEPADFRQRNVLNIGMEAGIEAQLPWFLLRLWGAADLSGFIKVGDNATISSLRGGVDTYYDLVEFSGGSRFSILVFTFGEKISIEKETSSEAIGTTGIKPNKVSYKLFFAGGGLSFTW